MVTMRELAAFAGVGLFGTNAVPTSSRGHRKPAHDPGGRGFARRRSHRAYRRQSTTSRSSRSVTSRRSRGNAADPESTSRLFDR